MKYTVRGILIVLLTLSLINSIFGQTAPARESKRKSSEASIEEQTVRALYAKVTRLNRASLTAPFNAEPTDDQVLQFELRDFKIGPIEEILSKRADDVRTGRAGPFIELTRQTFQHNGGPEYVAYRATWTDGEYASVYEPEWTMNELLNFQPDRNSHLKIYASFHVRVRFENKQRDYRAVAMFPDKQDVDGKPKFWDLLIGRGGVLNDVWAEQLPPVTEMKLVGLRESAERYTGAADQPSQDVAVPQINYSLAFSRIALPDTTTWGSVSRPTISNTSQHTSGEHGQTVGFIGACTNSSTQQFCQVLIQDTFTFERGNLTLLLKSHVNKASDKAETATGPLGTEIKCFAARGVATSSCLNPDCDFEVGLQSQGGSLKMMGGNVWNGELIHTHTCRTGFSSGGGTCTAPSFDGKCPLGSSPNGQGLCCFNLTNSCSLAFASRCLRFGGDYDFGDCSCSGCASCGGSPIVIDVKGDGIALTNAAEGTEFDLNGNGTREKLGWTKPNSDDAWLALDRNNNGNIDNGGELFGDFTTQPPSSDKNGFLALAEFDKETNGGNQDGIVDSRDSIFSSLRLWQDVNHNGVAESGELHTLSELDIMAFDLDFKESNRVDEFGNEFRYKGKVRDLKVASVARWAWDVFLIH